MAYLWAVAASSAVSLISFAGIFAFLLQERLLRRVLVLLIGFSAGALIGGAFLHILPEAIEQAPEHSVFSFVLGGFVLFFILERFIHWRHCHEGHCDIHAFTYLNLIGDGLHNLVDGLVIGASFTVDIRFGAITSLVIMFHELPQEIGDMGVLLYGGFSKSKALVFNFLSALTCILGTLIGYPLASRLQGFTTVLLPVVAGGFIYIAASDLIPELHKQADRRRSMLSIVAFLCGIAFILSTHLLHAH